MRFLDFFLDGVVTALANTEEGMDCGCAKERLRLCFAPWGVSHTTPTVLWGDHSWGVGKEKHKRMRKRKDKRVATTCPQPMYEDWIPLTVPVSSNKGTAPDDSLKKKGHTLIRCLDRERR